jgi:invasion protein IalB
MKHSGPLGAQVLRRACVMVTAVGLAAIAPVPHALAQQPVPKAQPKAPPKAQPKAPEKAAPAPADQQSQREPPQLLYAPWTKVCQTGPEPNPKQVCFTGKGGRLESGEPVVGAVVIAPEGEEKKVLRVTVPLGVALQPGTRIIIDQGQPIGAPYVMCVPGGCMSDYEVSNDLIGAMKTGQTMHVQGLNDTGQPLSIPLPLADFAKAFDGPPSDPKAVADQNKRLQEELEKRGEEARKKLEGQQTAPPR